MIQFRITFNEPRTGSVAPAVTCTTTMSQKPPPIFNVGVSAQVGGVLRSEQTVALA